MARAPRERPTGHSTHRLLALGFVCAAIGFWVGDRLDLTDRPEIPPLLNAPDLSEPTASESTAGQASELRVLSQETLPGMPASETRETEYLPVVPWDRACLLTGRLFDEHDQLVVESWLRIGVHFGEHRFENFVQTDSAGSFSFPVKGAIPADEFGLLAIERSNPPSRTTHYSPPTHQAIVELPALLPNGAWDLEDLQLSEKTAMLTGSVFDQNGIPIIARLEVATFRQSDEVPRLWSLYSDNGEFSLCTGQFDAHRLDSIHRGWLTVECPGFASILKRPFTPGAHVLIEMRPGTELRGTISGTRTDPLTIVLTGSDGVERSPRGWLPGEEHAEWWMHGVPLGHAQLSIQDAAGRSFVGTFDVREESTVPSMYGVLLR